MNRLMKMELTLDDWEFIKRKFPDLIFYLHHVTVDGKVIKDRQ